MLIDQFSWKNILSVTLLTGLSYLSFPASGYADIEDKNIAFATADTCIPDIINVPKILKNAINSSGDESINVEADSLNSTNDVITLNGNAQLIRGKTGLFADHIEYDKTSYIASANGDVRYYSNTGDEIVGNTISMDVDTFIGFANDAEIKVARKNMPDYEQRRRNFTEDYSLFAPFRNTSYTPTETLQLDPNQTYVQTRARAKKIDLQGTGHQTLFDAILTFCKESNEDVSIHAKKIELDHDSGIGVAKSMSVRFKNVPVFYFPHASFPINDERKSGFLFPSIGYEEESGAVLEIPYYFNLAPNYDLTLTPTLYTKRGVQLFGEYRYLSKNYVGEIQGGILPKDRIFKKTRYAYKIEHEQQFGKKWFGQLELQNVSDTQYVSDFNTDIETAAISFVPQRVELNYRGDLFEFDIETNTYVPINDAVSASTSSYQVRPEIYLDIDEQKFGFTEFGMDVEYTEFRHTNKQLVHGRRIRFRPYLSLPIESAYGFVTPKVSLQTIKYSLRNTSVTANKTPSISVPIYSIDSGLFFERPVQRRNTRYTQTLEPRLFYVDIPRKLQQNDFPVFDTSLGSASSFGYFFRENRFFGGDRVGDTKHLAVGLVSRITDDQTGLERMKLSLGQVYYLSDREISLSPNAVPETNNRSDFLAEITAGINQNWSVGSFTRLNKQNQLVYIDADIDYFHSERRNASIGYTRINENGNGTNQVNLELTTPFAKKWQLSTSYDYSIDEQQSRAAVLQIAYDDCCWATAITIKRFLDGQGKQQNSIIFTLALDNLGTFRNPL